MDGLYPIVRRVRRPLMPVEVAAPTVFEPRVGRGEARGTAGDAIPRPASAADDVVVARLVSGSGGQGGSSGGAEDGVSPPCPVSAPSPGGVGKVKDGARRKRS